MNPLKGPTKPASTDTNSTIAGSSQGPGPEGSSCPPARPAGRENHHQQRNTQDSVTQGTGRSGKSPPINTSHWERTWKSRKLHAAMTHTQNYPPEKKLFSFSCEPNLQSQPKNNIEDRSFLFIHKSFRMRRGHPGKCRTALSSSSFSEGNSNVLGEKVGRIQGKKDFLDSYEKHSSSMNTMTKIWFLKKYYWHPFDLV